jgi:N-acetylglucosaminyl-diphospho-decaprenol L-rhamnosyltransferase
LPHPKLAKAFSSITTDQKQAPIPLSVLIVSFNTRYLTLDCLRSLYAETLDISFEVIVVDNASSDGSAPAIAEAFPQVRLIALDKNLGFGPANNLAAKQAVGKYVLLLNSDTVVLDRAVDRLVTFAETNQDAMIWGGRTVFPDGTLNPQSCWRYMSRWSLFCHASGLTGVFRSLDFFNREAYGGWDRGSERQVEFVSGCFLLTTRKTWEALGGFDERFFMYAEEADLCFRAEAFGAKPMVTPKATIIHYGGKSEAVREDKLVKLFAGRMTFAIKHWSTSKASSARYLMLLHCRIRAISEAVLFKKGRPWTGLLVRRQSWENGYPAIAGVGSIAASRR